MVPVVLWDDWPWPSWSNLTRYPVNKTLFGSRSGPVTGDRHPIWALSRIVAARWFYCSMNPSQHQELYLLLRTPCCARTHSIAIDLITSKVWYSRRFTAEHWWRMRNTLTQQASSAGQTTGSWHRGSTHMRDTLPSPPGTGFQNTAVSPKLQGNIWDCNQRTDS